VGRYLCFLFALLHVHARFISVVLYVLNCLLKLDSAAPRNNFLNFVKPQKTPLADAALTQKPLHHFSYLSEAFSNAEVEYDPPKPTNVFYLLLRQQ